MDFSKYTPLKKGGAKKAAETFSSTRKKHVPSERLIKIISEVQPDQPDQPESNENKNKKIARDAEA